MKPESTPLLSTKAQPSTGTRNEAARKISVLVPLVVIVLSFAYIIIGISYRDGVIQKTGDAFILLSGPTLQTIWAAFVIQAGHQQQLFLRRSILESLPIVWLPFVSVSLLMISFSLRWNLVMKMVDYFPITVFVALQAVRVLAVGSLLKWKMGLFPTVFAWGTAFPDMLFGISAIFLLVFQNHKEYPMNAFFLMVWNALGFAIILPIGVVLLQLGMSPTKLYDSRVSNDVLFEYPMVLGPALVVPTLLTWNAIVVAWALEQMK